MWRTARSIYQPVWAVFAACALLPGCSPSTSPSASSTESGPQKQASLRVLVVDDSELAETLREQWQLREVGDGLEVRTATSKDLSAAKRLSADVVVFPARWMGELAERELIQPIPAAMLSGSEGADGVAPLMAVGDLLPTVRHCDASWGRQLYAVPLGSPQLVLLYRPDVFAKLDLDPPQTWEEYQAILPRLADRTALGELAPAEGRPWHAALEPTAEGWAGISLLARAASAVRAEGQLYALFDSDDMSSRIAAPPFVQTAGEMAAAAQASNASQRRLTPAEVRAAFFAGECGMAITWPSAAGATVSKTPVAFAELPGRDQSFHFQSGEWVKKGKDADPRTSLCAIAGRLAAVTREARRSRAAFALLGWLGSPEASRAISPTSQETTLFGRSQLSAPGPWLGSEVSANAAASYSQVAEAASSRTQWMPVARIPGVEEYHAALDAAVLQSLADPDQAEAALSAAAKQWDAITQRQDVARQRRAYQRSLGNDF